MGTIMLRVVQACARTLRWVIRDITRIVRQVPVVHDEPWFVLLLARLSDVEFAKNQVGRPDIKGVLFRSNHHKPFLAGSLRWMIF